MKTRAKRQAKPKNSDPPKPAGPKKVFIVEDHPVFREGLVHLINEEDGLALCGTAADALTARRDIARLKPDLVLVDISLPGKSGLELIKELRKAYPELKLLVVSMHDEALYANRVLRLGGDGYIMKKEDPSEIVHAMWDVLEGHIYVSEAVLSSRARAAHPTWQPTRGRRFDQLTDGELETLELLGKGKTTEEIADQAGAAVSAVEAACEEIRRKLNLSSDNALIRYAVCWVETGRS